MNHRETCGRCHTSPCSCPRKALPLTKESREKMVFAAREAGLPDHPGSWGSDYLRYEATVVLAEHERDRWKKRWTSLGDDFDNEVPGLREENKRLREALKKAAPIIGVVANFHQLFSPEMVTGAKEAEALLLPALSPDIRKIKISWYQECPRCKLTEKYDFLRGGVPSVPWPTCVCVCGNTFDAVEAKVEDVLRGEDDAPP